ncbi:MAG: dephospho-CoA kinase [Eubacteriales bacterium]|nr:dephospho-CoA kinase [Eubacteriales bacterium]
MKLIGITGGIGAGKSSVSDYLIKKGYVVLDADKVSKELLISGSPLLLHIRNLFGETILNQDGSLNRKVLSDIVFSNPVKKAILDKTMHGKILEIILDRLKNFSNEKVVFIDAALLFEANWDSYMDQIWVVDADVETRILRVINRDPLSREEVIKRMENQMERKERLKKADYILDNSKSKDELYKQVNELLNKL